MALWCAAPELEVSQAARRKGRHSQPVLTDRWLCKLTQLLEQHRMYERIIALKVSVDCLSCSRGQEEESRREEGVSGCACARSIDRRALSEDPHDTGRN